MLVDIEWKLCYLNNCIGIKAQYGSIITTYQYTIILTILLLAIIKPQ